MIRQAPPLVLALVSACSDPSPPEERIANGVPAPSGVDFALEFDGANDYATMGTARFVMPTMAQTISLWLAPRPTGTSAALVTLRRDDSGNEFGLSAAGAPQVTRIWGSTLLVESTQPLAPGRWQHLAYVYDIESHALYVDGVKVATNVDGPNNRSPTSGWLGSYDGERRCFAGLLDELRIWAVARSPAELAAEIAGDAPTTDPDLVAYFSFDEADGPRVYDRSGNGNHMTLGDGLAQAAPRRVPSTRP